MTYIINIKKYGEVTIPDEKALPLKSQWENWMNNGRRADLNRVVQFKDFTGTFQDVLWFKRYKPKKEKEYPELTDEQRAKNKEILSTMGQELKAKGVFDHEG